MKRHITLVMWQWCLIIREAEIGPPEGSSFRLIVAKGWCKLADPVGMLSVGVCAMGQAGVD
jgi:hypothetical protein